MKNQKININEILKMPKILQDEVLDELNKVLENKGFLYIQDDEINFDLINKMQEVTKAFFNKDLKEKLQIVKPKNGSLRGYNVMASESLGQSLDLNLEKDLNESFQIGPILFSDNLQGPECFLQYAENIWPKEPHEMKLIWELYYKEMEKLSEKILKLFALCLNIPKLYFENLNQDHTSRLRARNYPQITQESLENQYRVSAHSDYGSFSLILHQEHSTGLEFLNSQHQWEDVVSDSNYFIMNVGDLMMRITNNFWKAPIHRVRTPKVNDQNNCEQLSIIYFHSFKFDALIDVYPSFYSDENIKNYEPVKVVNYLMNKLNKARYEG